MTKIIKECIQVAELFDNPKEQLDALNRRFTGKDLPIWMQFINRKQNSSSAMSCEGVVAFLKYGATSKKK